MRLRGLPDAIGRLARPCVSIRKCVNDPTMKTILLLGASLCLALQSFGAQIYFANDIGTASAETNFNNYDGGVGALKESQSGRSVAGQLYVYQAIGYHIAKPDGTDDGADYGAYTKAFLESWFAGSRLDVESEVRSERGNEADLPRDYNPLVTGVSVAATASLYWDFFVVGGNVTIDASVRSGFVRDPAQYVRLSGSSGLIFDLNYETASDPFSDEFFELPEPITLTPGRYLLQAHAEAINGGDEVTNRFKVNINGVDRISHHHVPDGGSSLALLTGGILTALAGRRLKIT